MKPICLVLASLIVSSSVFSSANAETKKAVDWKPWSDTLFEEAKRDKKLVLLDLGTSWCHWCHVMEEVTYADPEVRRLLENQYIAVKVDADQRPDLATRYEDYGWPATILFKWDGSELAKRQGYIPPKPMASMLQAFIDDPTPGPSVTSQDSEPATPAPAPSDHRMELNNRIVAAYDKEHGGWGDSQHFLNWNALEWCLLGDDKMKEMAFKTLKEGQKLIDPVWGGVYQYSTDGDWDHPHFEKIMPFQAENLRIFALATVLSNDPKWLEPAQKIHRYLSLFLTSPEGAFYTSQDADLIQGEHSGGYFALNDHDRRERGIPRIDKHIYSRENGLAITGLCALYAASGDATCLSEARRAADWIIANRALPDGGFRHDEKDAAGPYLGDTLAMGRAFLALYTVTAERVWLKRAGDAAKFIEKNFRGTNGYLSSVSGGVFQPLPQVDENVWVVRFANLLFAHTGEEKNRETAAHAMKYLADPAVTDKLGYGTAGVLLAGSEFDEAPPHVTIVGSKRDTMAQSLFAAALRSVPLSAQIEWLDANEGPMPNEEITYPELDHAAAFVCADGRCSLPMDSPERLEAKLRQTKR